MLIAWTVVAVIVGLLIYGSYVNTAPAEPFKQITPNIYQDPATGEVKEVIHFLRTRFLKNPDSYIGMKWFQMTRDRNGNFEVRHQFRCSTPEGEPADPVSIKFTLGPDGRVIDYR